MELRISNRTVARVFLVVTSMALGLYFLWAVRSVVILVGLAVFLAVALGPPVDVLARRGVPRALAILLVYLGIGLAIFGIGLLVVPPLVSGVDQLSRDLPGYIDHLRHSRSFRQYDDKYDITTKLNQQASTLPTKLGSAVSTLQSVTVGVFSALVQLVTVLTMTFFLLIDGPRVVDFLVRVRPTGAGDRLPAILGDIYRSTAGYVAGNIIISLCAGTVTWATLTALGVPFAVPLAVLMAFLDLIPLVGATIGGVIIGLVTLFDNFPTSTIVWVVVLLLYQQVENNVLQPVVYRRTVNVHPLLVIVAVLVGSSLLGVLGALLAIPIAAAIQIVARELWVTRNRAPSVVVPADEDVMA
ncbi:MAG: family transporter [Conexibacter sp.]|jgi:predicted PurR-regulated permease PerM|nr:family transporter [Conexibacter sp.]